MDVLITIERPDQVEVDGCQVVELPLCDVPTVGAVVTVPTDDAFDAVAQARTLVAPLGGRVVRMVVRDLDHEPELPVVGVSEFAEARGVERHYASQICRRAEFPAQTAVLAAGPVWDLIDVAQYLAEEAAMNGTRRRKRRR